MKRKKIYIGQALHQNDCDEDDEHDEDNINQTIDDIIDINSIDINNIIDDPIMYNVDADESTLLNDAMYD